MLPVSQPDMTLSDQELFGDDHPHDHCGVFGVWAPGEDVSRLTYFSLYALQHRGQQSAGIATSNGKGDLLVVTERGYGKRTPVAEYPEQRRGGQGVSTISMTARKGDLVACRVVGPQHELMMVSEEGVVIRMKTTDISRLGRATQGVRIMNMGEHDRVSAVARMVARKKKAPKASRQAEGQSSLDLGLDAAGAQDADEEAVDIGGEEEPDDSMIEDEGE